MVPQAEQDFTPKSKWLGGYLKDNKEVHSKVGKFRKNRTELVTNILYTIEQEATSNKGHRY